MFARLGKFVITLFVLFIGGLLILLLGAGLIAVLLVIIKFIIGPILIIGIGLIFIILLIIAIGNFIL